MRPHQIERRRHDYKQNGTVQLFAALEVHRGRAVSCIEERHRSQEVIARLERLLRTYTQVNLPIILDNLSSHHSRAVQE